MDRKDLFKKVRKDNGEWIYIDYDSEEFVDALISYPVNKLAPDEALLYLTSNQVEITACYPCASDQELLTDICLHVVRAMYRTVETTVITGENGNIYCPTCEHKISAWHGRKFCPDCGQRLFWG